MARGARKQQTPPEEGVIQADGYPLPQPSSLAAIKGFAQEVVMAIAAVTRVDVTIVDENLVRIAGTGRYIDELDTMLTHFTISDQVLRTGEIFVLEHPRDDPRCQRCGIRGRCRETAEISYPIRLGDRTVANMGLIAFTEEQRRVLLDNREDYITYLSYMSKLLASRLESLEKNSQLLVLKRQLENLIDIIDQAVIYVGERGDILLFNRPAREYFGNTLRPGAAIKKVIPDIELDSRNHSDQIITHDADAYSVSITTIEGVGRLLQIQHITRLQEKEQEIRRRLSAKPPVAVYTFADLIGNHPRFASAVKMARTYSQVDATVLITAETGTGKELFAQAMHNASARRRGPFVAINCAALPESLLESELFGYAGGAFTGARRQGKEGLFEQAHRGTIFLDEIAEMPLRLQSSLLRVLQDKEVRRIGDDKVIPVDVRIIAATNKKMRSMVLKGEFREDLYYRLNMLRLRLPTLAERAEDIPLLVQHFAIQACRQFHRPPVAFTKPCLDRLCQYPWPGNIRELFNVIQRAVLLTETAMIDRELIDVIIEDPHGEDLPDNLHRFDLELGGDWKDVMAQMISILRQRIADEDEVARLLGVSKTTLWRRMNSK